MNSTEFSSLKQSVKNLSPKQKKQLEEMRVKPEEISLITKLLDAKVAKCPHCEADDLQKWGISSNRQRYRCKSCKKTFNGLIGTELNGMHYQDKWDRYIETMLQGTFLREAAAECGISLNTSFNSRHKFLKLVDNLTDSHLEGIVEHFNWSEKGSRNLGREARKRELTRQMKRLKLC